MILLKKSIVNRRLSLILLVFSFVLDSVLVVLFGVQFHNYFPLLYIVCFLYYYRSHYQRGWLLLDLALVSQMIGLYFVYFLPNSMATFFGSILMFNLNLLFLSYLISKCTSISDKRFYLVGPLLIIPYLMVIFFQLNENFDTLLWIVLFRVPFLLIFVSVSFAHFSFLPTLKSSFVMIGSLLIVINNILFAYNYFYFKEIFFSYEKTLFYLLGTFLIIKFLEQKLEKKEDSLSSMI